MYRKGESTFLIVAGGHDGAAKLASTEVPRLSSGFCSTKADLGGEIGVISPRC